MKSTLKEKLQFQECSIDMVVNSLDQETVSLVPGNFTMWQTKDMTLFTITRSVLEETRFPRNGQDASSKTKVLKAMDNSNNRCR